MVNWLLVDDSRDERRAYARALSEGASPPVVAISASEARHRLASSELVAKGILMDVDLSNETANMGSGLGLTADIRAAQYRQSTKSFPIVRFSYRQRVAENIGSDSSSDELFDLKIDKDDLDLSIARNALAGVADVYEILENGRVTATEILGVNDEQWSMWGSTEFAEDLASADRDYLKARLVAQALILPGMLIQEDLLAARVGIWPAFSRGWDELRDSFDSFAYTGVAAGCFPLWWARGLEGWWEDRCSEAPLAATRIADRHQVLSETFKDLRALEMPASSLGDRPWRRCELTFERTGEFLPVDPSKAVRLRPRELLPDWLDPTYAALGRASQYLADPRINQGDLSRLKKLVPRSST